MRANYLLLFLSALFLTNCAHYPDVRPSAKGDHKVIFQTERKGEGFKKAFAQAKDYCDDNHEQKAMHVKEESKYIGSMDEDTYNKSKTATKAIKTIGVGGMAFGGKKERKAGRVGAFGGGVGDSALGLGYEYTMWFHCK